MELSRINTNLLVALDLLLEEQSVSRAAERHGVTASAMSHSLRALREVFEDPLLTKTRNGMRVTPYASALKGPLRRALRDLERAVSGGLEFDPSTAERSFIVAAPDFLSTLVMPHVARLLSDRFPGVDVEVRPVQRRGSSLLLRDAAALAEGDIDLVLAAILGDVPDMMSEPLYDERFVCVVREDHPEVGTALDLETYARLPHLLTTITDERTPSYIDAALAEHGLRRRVALRTRFFMSVPLVVAQSDLITTCPYQLARYFASLVPIRILEPPVQLPQYSEFVAWHRRYDADPGLVWLRGVMREAAAAAVQEPSPSAAGTA